MSLASAAMLGEVVEGAPHEHGVHVAAHTTIAQVLDRGQGACEGPGHPGDLLVRRGRAAVDADVDGIRLQVSQLVELLLAEHRTVGEHAERHATLLDASGDGEEVVAQTYFAAR